MKRLPFKKAFKLLFIHFILPISIGTLIYLLFRPTHLTVFHWVEAVSLYNTVINARAMFTIGHLTPEWVINSLPNGIWAYSFMFFISFIWGCEKSLEKKIFIVLVVALSVGSELGQLLNFVRGTFCLTDVLFYTFGLFAGYYLGKSYYWRGTLNEKV